MPVLVTDEDVDLISGALTNAGWHITTHTNQKKADKELRVILQAFLDGKHFDVGTPGDLTEDQALSLLHDAVNEVHIDVEVESKMHTMDVHSFEYGSGKVVTGPTEHIVTLKIHKFQIKPLLNYIKNKLWG
jgi:hypothetical protein